MKRVLLIDDHDVVRIGLKKMLADELSDLVWGEARSAAEALELAHQEEWDLLILELSIDCNRGLDLLKEVKRKLPRVPVLVLSGYSEEQYAVRAIRAGASGYVTKTASAAEVVKAAKVVLPGGRYVSDSLAEALSADQRRFESESVHERLSDREFQILRLIGAGKTVGQIAALLSISDKTVSTHRARILEKTRMKNSAELVRYVIEHGLVD
jgi:DNA-binding NarL/FixJ family response regulator